MHGFLAIMLGFRRPGITIAVSVLVRHGLIMSKRRGLMIIDRAGLKRAATGCYGTAEAESARVCLLKPEWWNSYIGNVLRAFDFGV